MILTKLDMGTETGYSHWDDAQSEIIDVNLISMDELNKRRVNFEQFRKPTGSDKEDWNPLTFEERNMNDLKSLFFEIWGVADHYSYGLMYYAVPIEALDKYGNPALTYKEWVEPAIPFTVDVKEPVQETDPYGWAKFYGYHGVVRNNWYNFTLRTINDLGIPVSDPTQPIVPNYHKKLDQIKLEMEILQWHIEDLNVAI